MTHLFKEEIPRDLFIEFIKNNFINEEIHNNKKWGLEGDKPTQWGLEGDKPPHRYILNKIIYKQIDYNGVLNDFLTCIEPCYHKSKRIYIEKARITYKSFLTVVRQLCKIFNIQYTHRLKYSFSVYDIEYTLYIA